MGGGGGGNIQPGPREPRTRPGVSARRISAPERWRRQGVRNGGGMSPPAPGAVAQPKRTVSALPAGGAASRGPLLLCQVGACRWRPRRRLKAAVPSGPRPRPGIFGRVDTRRSFSQRGTVEGRRRVRATAAPLTRSDSERLGPRFTDWHHGPSLPDQGHGHLDRPGRPALPQTRI